MPPKVSVILCTHQPRPDYLARTLAGLRAQTLAVAEWELVVVDNCSTPPVAHSLDLSWHPGGRILREERPGQAFARVTGLKQTTGEIIVFVDDDNLLAPNYLETAIEIAARWHMLGTWGGRLTPLFEQEPPDWVHRFMYHLAITWCEEPTWSSFVSDRTLPVGAGLCLRRSVAEVYLEKAWHDPGFELFGRRPGRNVSGDDQYITFCAQELGLGAGRFPQLRLDHLIPAERLMPASFLRMVEGNAHGAMLLQAVWQNRQTYRDKLFVPLLKVCALGVLRRGMHRRIGWAEARGEFGALLEARRLRRGASAGVAEEVDAAALTRPS